MRDFYYFISLHYFINFSKKLFISFLLDLLPNGNMPKYKIYCKRDNDFLTIIGTHYQKTNNTRKQLQHINCHTSLPKLGVMKLNTEEMGV